MAESQSGFDVEAFKNDLDDICSGVMPDSWAGHGRLKIAEREFSEAEKTFAEKLLHRLNEKHPDLDSETLAEKAIAETEKRF